MAIKPPKRPAIESDEVAEGVTPTASPKAVAGDGGPSLPVRARSYKGTEEVDHDLFKLTVARMSKNVSYSDVPDLVRFEHCHIFHTVDSSGKKQTTTNAVGGHFHEVEVVNVPGGVPTLKISEPRKWVLKKIRGRMQRVAVPVVHDTSEPDGVSPEGVPYTDRHTHEAIYLRSERIKLRSTNEAFAAYEAAERARKEPPPVEGVQAR